MSENTNREGIKATQLSAAVERVFTRNIFLSIAAATSLLILTPVTAQDASPETGEEPAQQAVEDVIEDISEDISGEVSDVTDEPVLETDDTDEAPVVSAEPIEVLSEEVQASADGATQSPDPELLPAEPVSNTEEIELGGTAIDVNGVDVTGPDAAESSLTGVDLSTYESPRDPIDTYLDAIEAAEIANGAYSTDLADLYLGLGQGFLEAREFEEAKEAFQQGMQIMRVNHGLNSPEQTSYLFAVADIESIQGNRKAANEVISHVYLINAKNFGRKAPEMVPVLTRILEWYSQHRPADAPDNFYEDLERAGTITSEMAEIIELDKGLGHPDTTAMYRKQGQIHWHTAKYVLGRGISVEPGVIMATGKPSYSVHVKEVSIKEHFREGREAFTKVAASVSMDENSSMLEKAESIAQVGDWNLAFGKKQAAGDAYIRAYNVLAQESRSEQVADNYFKDPIPVRFMDDNLQSHQRDIAASIFIKASMTVTEGGRSLNIDLIDPPEVVPATQLRAISRELNGMHFRPALGEGVPVRTDGFIFEYPLTLMADES